MKKYLLYIVLAILLALPGCKQVQYVPIEKVKTDTTYINKIHYDSIEIKVKEYIGGDTVYRDSIVFRYLLRTDTVYTYSRDSIPYPVEVVKEVERNLNWYEKTMIRLGWALIVLLIGVVGWKVFKWYRQIRV